MPTPQPFYEHKGNPLKKSSWIKRQKFRENHRKQTFASYSPGTTRSNIRVFVSLLRYIAHPRDPRFNSMPAASMPRLSLPCDTLVRLSSLFLLRPGCVMGLVLVGWLDFLGFHCATRMVTQGIGSRRSR